jgi:hypothetical protein
MTTLFDDLERQVQFFVTEGPDPRVRLAFHTLFIEAGWFSDKASDDEIIRLLATALRSARDTNSMTIPSPELECEVCALSMRTEQPARILSVHDKHPTVFKLLALLVQAVRRKKKKKEDNDVTCKTCRRHK